MLYLIAVDGSQNASCAFDTCVGLIKPVDELLIVTVVSPYLNLLPFSMAEEKINQWNEELGMVHRRVLHTYAREARKKGINYHLLYAMGGHAGETLCSIAKERGVDCIVIGRRGLSKARRLFAGSTSQYCLQNAECNVMIVKANFTGEEHGRIADIVHAEEKERRRRVKEECCEAIKHDVPLEEIIKAEERERKRRMEESSSGLHGDKESGEKLKRDWLEVGEEVAKQARLRCEIEEWICSSAK